MPIPPPPDLLEVESLVRLYRKHAQEISALQEAQAALRARFAALVPLGFSLDVDGKTAERKAPNRSFSVERALAVAASANIPVKWTEEVDARDLRERLKAAGQLDEAMVPGSGAERVTLG